jgi:ParB family transcriptional regulator, chromosome partitioning protein
MSLTEIPLSSLILSALNVRHTERDADIAGLADSIAEAGLKQNLVVVPAHFSTGEALPVAERSEAENASTGWDSKWEVIDGGRRFQAMQLLVADGRWPADQAVPCRMEERDNARETSLITNLQRVAMNPADEFAAFQQIVAERYRQGVSEEAAITYTARRFGVTVKHVQGRLRLAALAPEILEALRSNAITLDIAKAYAGTSDQDLQRTVFNAVSKKPYQCTARDIRYRLRGVTCSIDDPRMQFIGMIAYRAAGGRTEAEMFMGTDGEERVVDVALLDKLVQEKGDELAAAAAKAAGWKSGLFARASAYMVKKPEGFTLIYHSADQVSKTKRKKCIAVYGLPRREAEDAVELEAYLEPAEPAEEQPRHDWEAERIAQQREREITIRAARMAIGPLSDGPLKGTPLEGQTYWPRYAAQRFEEDDDGFALIALQIRVPVADIEAHRAEAERLIDAEAAERIRQLAEEYPDIVKPIAQEAEA